MRVRTWVICTKEALSAATQTPTVSTRPPTFSAELSIDYDRSLSIVNHNHSFMFARTTKKTKLARHSKYFARLAQQWPIFLKKSNIEFTVN